MAFIQRLLILAFLPILALFTLQAILPDTLRRFQDAIEPYTADIPLLRSLSVEQLPPRSETPLVFTGFAHWSHYEKIAKIAVVLAELGYPITFITGRIFEDDVKKLHPNIKFWPIRGKPDKLTEEEYEKLKTFEPGSVDEQLFMQIKAQIDGIPDQHETLQEVFRHQREQYGETKPILSFFDLVYAGHHVILLGADGIKPDSSFGLACHPMTADSNDTFPSPQGRLPHTGPDAKAIHHEANQVANRDYHTTEVSKAYWRKMKEVGAKEEHDWHIYHSMAALPDHMMMLGVPEFEFPRSDLRYNVHYFGGLKTKKSQTTSASGLPKWWEDVAKAKRDGKKIIAVSQGTVGTNLKMLLIPTLEALKDREDVLVIATTVALEPEEVQDLVIPSNARVAKFVPYDVLLPQIDVLVNNGGYGAVIQSLQAGVPLVVAGTGQDKDITNTIIHWKEVGVNLGRVDPSVDQIRESVNNLLDDKKFKRNALAMSKNFERYDLGTVFDKVIKGVVRDWQKSKRHV